MAGASASGLLRCAWAASGTAVIASATSSAKRFCPRCPRCPQVGFIFKGMSFVERRVACRLRSTFRFTDAALTGSLVLELPRRIETGADIENQVVDQGRVGVRLGPVSYTHLTLPTIY